jgi:hypothetical protein
MKRTGLTLIIYQFNYFYQCVGKNLALLQAEASACELELANVPNVRWLVVLSMKHNVLRVWCRLAIGSTNLSN